MVDLPNAAPSSRLPDPRAPTSSSTAANAYLAYNFPDDNEVIIAVMGATGSGKTTFINDVSSSSLRVGKGLQSCTNVVQVAEPFQLNGRNIVLIDTPGFDDTTKSDTDILRMIAAYLATTYESGRRLAGVIYIHRISDFRMGGISTRNFRMFRELCGDSTLKNVVIVTNMWGQVSEEVGEARERELATENLFFKPVLDKGARMLRHDNTVPSAQNILKHFLDNHPLPLQIQRELVDQGKDILQTAAGEELNRELVAQLKAHQEEMRQLQREILEAVKAKDEETRREIEAEMKKLQAEMSRMQGDAQKLAQNYQEERVRLENRMKEMSEEYQRNQEETEARYRQQVQALETRLRSQTEEPERAKATRQLEELRNRPPPYLHGDFFRIIAREINKIFGL